MYGYALLTLSTDIAFQPGLPSSETDLQLALLKIFFADVTTERTTICRDNPQNYLRWGGVTLTDGCVSSVMYRYLKLGNLNVHALPHSTTEISIISSQQKYSLQTRMLPKKLQKMDISHNEIFGTVDLTTLPEGLQELSARFNVICGPINLTKLPRALERMNFRGNAIDQKVVFYGDLPPKISQIALGGQREVTHGIKAVRPVCVEDKISDENAREIFQSIKHYN